MTQAGGPLAGKRRLVGVAQRVQRVVRHREIAGHPQRGRAKREQAEAQPATAGLPTRHPCPVDSRQQPRLGTPQPGQRQQRERCHRALGLRELARERGEHRGEAWQIRRGGLAERGKQERLGAEQDDHRDDPHRTRRGDRPYAVERHRCHAGRGEQQRAHHVERRGAKHRGHRARDDRERVGSGRAANPHVRHEPVNDVRSPVEREGDVVEVKRRSSERGADRDG